MYVVPSETSVPSNILNVEKKVTIISATHDLKMLDVSDRIVDIRDGVIERIRNRDEIDVQVGEVGGGH